MRWLALSVYPRIYVLSWFSLERVSRQNTPVWCAHVTSCGCTMVQNKVKDCVRDDVRVGDHDGVEKLSSLLSFVDHCGDDGVESLSGLVILFVDYLGATCLGVPWTKC